MQISNVSGGRYFDALHILDAQDGAWFASDYLDVVTASLQIDASSITGQLWFEGTADPAHAIGVSPIVLPYGCLHTDKTTITLASPATIVNLAAMAAGAFTITFALPFVGALRMRWKFTSGGGGNNKISAVINARRVDR